MNGLADATMDHVGIVVRDLDQALTTYCEGFGFRLLERRTAPEHGVEVAFLDAGSGALELLSPLDEESGVARFLASRGEGTHHVCLAVANIRDALADLKAQGLQLIDETPRQGLHGLVAFVHPKAAHGVLIELLEKQEH